MVEQMRGKVNVAASVEEWKQEVREEVLKRKEKEEKEEKEEEEVLHHSHVTWHFKIICLHESFELVLIDDHTFPTEI